jgi:lipid-A-disaccharide synthase-like uncharacterized protein
MQVQGGILIGNFLFTDHIFIAFFITEEDECKCKEAYWLEIFYLWTTSSSHFSKTEKDECKCEEASWLEIFYLWTTSSFHFSKTEEDECKCKEASWLEIFYLWTTSSFHFLRQKEMNASARRHLDWKFSIYGPHLSCNFFYNRRRWVQVRGGILVGNFLFMDHIFIATSYSKGGPLVFTARGAPAKGAP